MDTTPYLVQRGAELWPDEEALVDGEVRMSFAELGKAVDRLAGAAVAAGLDKGDRVAIWGPNVWEWVVTALGVQAAGVVVVPLNTRFKGDEAAYVLERSGARMLFTVRGFLGIDYPALLEGRRTSIERTVVFGDSSWDDFLQGQSSRRPEVGEADLSDIIFTSGTTGRPKGVMSTHGQSVRVVRDWGVTIGLRARDRYCVVSPFFHTMGYKAGFIGALQAGAATLPVATLDVPALLALVERERISVMPGAPTLFQTILAHPDRHRYDTSSLRLSGVGAASVPVELVERMRSELFSTVVTGYGLTESTGISTMSRPEDPPEIVSRTVGRALPDVEVTIVGPQGEPLPPGTPGEVLVRGYNVMKGYFDAPDETASVIDADGWLHTGDVGRLDSDGYLSITDRIKDVYTVGGFNAYPAEIEAILARHPDVAMAAVIGVPDTRLGEVGMAFVVPVAGSHPEPEAIIGWCRAEMANYKVPRRVEIVEALPLNAVGKVVKDHLRARAADFVP